MTCGGGAGFTPLYIAVLLLFFSPCIGVALAAQEPVGNRVSFQPGGLELSGTTALSVQYQIENGDTVTSSAATSPVLLSTTALPSA